MLNGLRLVLWRSHIYSQACITMNCPWTRLTAAVGIVQFRCVHELLHEIFLNPVISLPLLFDELSLVFSKADMHTHGLVFRLDWLRRRVWFSSCVYMGCLIKYFCVLLLFTFTYVVWWAETDFHFITRPFVYQLSETVVLTHRSMFLINTSYWRTSLCYSYML